jgi:malate/lactate dehydrogenase
VVTRAGIHHVVKLNLNDQEKKALFDSSVILKKNLDSLQ